MHASVILTNCHRDLDNSAYSLPPGADHLSQGVGNSLQRGCELKGRSIRSARSDDNLHLLLITPPPPPLIKYQQMTKYSQILAKYDQILTKYDQNHKVHVENCQERHFLRMTKKTSKTLREDGGRRSQSMPPRRPASIQSSRLFL